VGSAEAAPASGMCSEAQAPSLLITMSSHCLVVGVLADSHRGDNGAARDGGIGGMRVAEPSGEQDVK
jgi:hypothetical protein